MEAQNITEAGYRVAGEGQFVKMDPVEGLRHFRCCIGQDKPSAIFRAFHVLIKPF